jgi:PAS domain S-box-containing protein
MARDKVRELERLFRGFAEASSDLIWIRDAESLAFEYSNAAFRSAYGLDGPAPPEEATAWRDRVHPGDRDRVLAEMRKVLAGDHVTQDFRILHARGGEMRWVRTTDFPLRDASGRVTRIGGIGQDVTDEKEAAQRLGVLVAELQHRTRNLLGVIRALAGRTLASSASLAEFKTRFEDRLGALARVNGLLSRLEEGDRITFDELIRTELRGHGALEDDWSGPQVGLSGPHGVRLRSANVQTFALALHELATNALKHGALSTATGRLDVSWDVIFDPHGTPRLKVDWRETGVSPCEDAETRGGYGRELIEQALPYQLNAEVAYRLTRRGVSCTIVLPLSAASERAGAGP